MRDQAQLERYLRKRLVAEPIIERILRLNPNGVPEGQIPRGWHRSFTKSLLWYENLVGKRAYVRKYGREAWDALPNGLKYRYGRRKYVAWETFEDAAHLIYMGKRKAHAVRIFEGRRYANDPNLVARWVIN